jgi:hypothetical protein
VGWSDVDWLRIGTGGELLRIRYFLGCGGSGTGSSQPREYSRAVNGVMCVAEK